MAGRLFKIKKQNCYLKTGVNTHTPVTPMQSVGSGVKGHHSVYSEFEVNLGYMRF